MTLSVSPDSILTFVGLDSILMSVGPDSILNPNVLSPRGHCQVEAARFISYCYKNQVAVGTSSVFDYKAALLSMLVEGHNLKKPVHVQMVSIILCHTLSYFRNHIFCRFSSRYKFWRVGWNLWKQLCWIQSWMSLGMFDTMKVNIYR